MIEVWTYTILSVLAISLISLVGVAFLALRTQKLKQLLLYIVSLSAGALFGNVFLHLLPEVVEQTGFTLRISLYVLLGIIFSFIIEKFIHWRHCHSIECQDDHIHPFAWMNLIGDSVHNLIDGILIAGSYLVSIPVGIATSLAVIFHEIPQEIGDFGVMVHGGVTPRKALLFNFLSALTAIVGAVFALLMNKFIQSTAQFLVPFAAGTFIYIAGSDLIPELHKEVGVRKSFIQFIAFIAGIAIMASLLVIG